MAAFAFMACHHQPADNQNVFTQQDTLPSKPDTPDISGMSYTILSHYLLKNPATFKDSLAYFAMARASQFDSLFTPAKGTNDRIVQPDFNSNWIIAVLGKGKQANDSVGIYQIQLQGGMMCVYTRSMSPQLQPLKQPQVLLATVAHRPEVDSISFFLDDQLVKRVAIER